MIIKKLELTAFGKFNNTTIELSEGLNLIGGSNESGKSTIHKFVEGMFFGFFKPYSRNKLYTEDYDKYMPWAGGDYRGSLEYLHEGTHYRLERTLHKNQESVRLYNLKTGKDLTDTLPFDPVQKLPKASYHLGLNNVLFRNTISIAQMSNATDADLVKEIGDLLINAEHSYDGTISFKKALETLQKSKNEIGTKKQSKSPLGANIARLDLLTQEQISAEEVESECREKYLKVRELEQMLGKLSGEKDHIKKDKERARIAALAKKYSKYCNLKNESDALKKQLNKPPTVTEAQFETYQQTRAKYELTKQNNEVLSVKQSLARKSLQQIKSEAENDPMISSKQPAEEIMQDAALLKRRLQQLEEHANKQSDVQSSSLSKNYKTLKRREKLFSIAGTTMTALGIAAAAVGYFFKPSFYYWAAGVGALGILMLILWGITTTKKSELEPYFDRYDTMKIRTTNMIVMCEIDIEQLKQKYRCSSTDQLKAILHNAQDDNAKKIQSDKLLEGQCQIINGIEQEILQNREEMNRYAEEMSKILRDAGAGSAEEMKQAILIGREQTAIKTKYDSLISAMDELLSNVSLVQLQTAAKQASEMQIQEAESEDAASEDQISQTSDRILEITAQIASLNGSISKAESTVRPLGEIEEELTEAQRNIAAYEEELAAYELAISTIETISEDIHGDFAETFNRYISDLVRTITDGKYGDIRVTNQLEIRVMDHEANKLAELNSLSGGTIDQLYFAVRFAIAELILQDQNVPMFLDDCFTQYDDDRLKQIISLIAKKAKQHQIIFMSCRRAESDILQASHAKYHEVML